MTQILQILIAIADPVMRAQVLGWYFAALNSVERALANVAEAEFFLENCPGVKMDGNYDGEPCERGPC